MAQHFRRARSRLSWKFGAIAAVLGTAALTFGIVSAAADTSTVTGCTNSLNGSTFEIDPDSNLKVDHTNCLDWLNSTGNTLMSSVKSKQDLPSGSNDDAFGQGTAENDTNPSIVFGSIPPNKSDLKTFGVNTEAGQVTTANPTGKFLQLYWGRVQNPSGTTNMDFELNQKVCDPSATTTNCADTATIPGTSTQEGVPVRTDGDLLITYDLSKGGTVPTISKRVWNGTTSQWGPATVISGAPGSGASALGSINQSSIPSTASDSVGPFDPFTFGEVSVAYSALFGTNTCGKFGSAYVKSRSSDSFTAEVKDFIAPEQVSISNCSGLTTTATSSATVGGNISDTAHLTGVSNDASGTITFHLFPSLTDCQNSTNEVSTGLTPVNVSGPNDYNSGNYQTTGAGTYYWTASYSGDANNVAVSTKCGDTGESTTVNKANSSIATSEVLVPNDTASITPSSASGTVDFYLFKPGDTCSAANEANAAYHQSVSLSSGSATTTNTSNTDTLAGSHTAAVGTWQWLVHYGGSGTLNGSDSTCTEAFTITNP